MPPSPPDSRVEPSSAGSSSGWNSVFESTLSSRSARHLLRRRRVVTPIDSTHVAIDGKSFVNFSSNDYLGLSRHPRVIEAVRAAVAKWGVGSGAAPLITGYTDAHAEAEQAIARWKGMEAAVLFPSGFQANLSAVQALASLAKEAGRSARFLIDKLAHASLVDAVRAVAREGSRWNPDAGSERYSAKTRVHADRPIAPENPGLREYAQTPASLHERSRSNGFRVFPHNGVAKLARLLADRPVDALDVILTESIFSMDGDAADLPAIARAKVGPVPSPASPSSIETIGDSSEEPSRGRSGTPRSPGSAARKPGASRRTAAPAACRSILSIQERASEGTGPTWLLVDEAHGSGVYGDGGAGLAAEMGLTSSVDVSVVTLSKAMGLAGGAVCGSAAFCDALVNAGRGYIYSTSPPACLAAGVSAAIGVMRDEPHRQRRVRALAARVRNELTAAGLRIPPGDSPIVPILLGSETSAMSAAERLADQGFLVLPIRPPTVARGTSRLRITLGSEHTDAEVEEMIAAVGSALADAKHRDPV